MTDHQLTTSAKNVVQKTIGGKGKEKTGLTQRGDGLVTVDSQAGQYKWDGKKKGFCCFGRDGVNLGRGGKKEQVCT